MTGHDSGNSLLISDAIVIDGVAERPSERQSIWVEAGRIRAIGRREELGTPASIPVLDARNKYVIPGLMDANLHLMGALHLEQLVRHEDQYEEIITEAAQVTLRAGLTTTFDTWGPRPSLVRVRDRINGGQIIGSRVFCAGNVVGLDGPMSLDFWPKATEVASESLVQRINSLWVENTGPDLTWMTPEEVAREIREYLRGGVDFINYSASDHRGAQRTAFLLFSPLAQSRIVDEAHRAGVVATAHTASVEALRVAIEAGSDIIQHCNITGPVPIPPATLELLVKRKTVAVIFPFTQRRLNKMERTLDAPARRYWSSADANCRALIESGVVILLGTDAVIHPEGEDNLMELGQGHFHWLTAMEEKGCPPMRLLQSATRNIAVAYGKDKDLGTLEVGKIADLLILNRNPLEAAKNYRAIDAVIKDGQIINTDSLPTVPVLSKFTTHRI